MERGSPAVKGMEGGRGVMEGLTVRARRVVD